MNIPSITITTADFYKQLHDFSSNTITDQETCLITNEPLENTHITLSCNHKFNYNALIYDIQSHKLNKKAPVPMFNCPYCRSIQTSHIPYNNTVPFIKGIHSRDDYNNFLLAKKEAKAAEAKAKKEAKAAEADAKKEAKAAEAKAKKEAKAAEAKAKKEAKAAEANAKKEAKADAKAK